MAESAGGGGAPAATKPAVVQGQHRAVSPGGDVTKHRIVPLFSGLTPLPGIEWFTGGLGGARGRLGCVSLSSVFGWLKLSSQSLPHHRKSVRTTEVTPGRSASWQAELHRLLHQVVVGDEEGSAVQWGAKVGMAVQLQRRLH